MTSYISDMNVYLGKDWQSATQSMTVTHATLKSHIRRMEVVDHKIYIQFLLLSIFISCTQELSTVIELSNRIVKECQGTLVARH
jgi:Ni,Fe-hydrogenase I cytochrome b subunit